MCIGVYNRLREYWDQKEWLLTELALALNEEGWYALVRWHQGKLQLVVRSPESMRKWKADQIQEWPIVQGRII